MGAQDRGTWIELPFWRQMKYYLLCVLIGIIIGIIILAIGVYTPAYQIAGARALNFLIVNWWVTPSTILILSTIVYARYKMNHKKKTVLEVKQNR
jgi:hypothetical protein